MKTETEVKRHRVPVEEFKAIAERYGLEVKENNGTFWVSLEVEEANTEITWFRV